MINYTAIRSSLIFLSFLYFCFVLFILSGIQYIIFMVRRAILMIAFPRVRTVYIYIYSCVHLREYALYTQLRKLRHSWGLGQLMGVVRNRTRALSLAAAGRKKENCYVETGTNSNLFYLKYIPKVLQDPLKCKESR